MLERRRLGVLSGAALALLTLTVTGIGPAVAVAALGPWAAGRLVSHHAHRYRRRLHDSLPEIARGLAAALGSGGSVRRALADLAPTLEGPAAVEIGRVCADIEVGEPPREALTSMARRSESRDIEELAGAITSQERSGGDLVALLNQLAAAAEARQRVEAEARAATAQARLTGGMVAAMPIAAGLLVELLQPGFAAALLADPLAAALVAAALVIQGFAWFVIQRLGGTRA